MNNPASSPLFESTENELNAEQILRDIHAALSEKGYNPVMQIVGYLLTEDPTYITNYNNARTLIAKIERDELLRHLLKSYLNI